MVIGVWVKRQAGRPSKWHLVESVVADDAVTHCGRRLRDEVGRLEVSTVMPLTRMIGQPQLCKQCDTHPPVSVTVNAGMAEGIGTAT